MQFNIYAKSTVTNFETTPDKTILNYPFSLFFAVVFASPTLRQQGTATVQQSLFVKPSTTDVEVSSGFPGSTLHGRLGWDAGCGWLVENWLNGLQPPQTLGFFFF